MRNTLNIALIALMGALAAGCGKDLLDCEDVGGADCTPDTEGPQGPTGATGAAGPAGANGEDGAPGAPGEPGVPGTNGTDGQDGQDGEPGATGATGEPGAPGANGEDGAPGAPGEPGVNGTDGANGTDGEDGAPGADGETGPQGEPGEQGPAGPECSIAETFPTYCGRGVCRADGTMTCVSGVLVSDCTAAAATGDDADCDGVDDDCDGAVDNRYAASATNCGVGACASTGTRTCSGAVESDSCVPRAVSVETFNGLDDDCDGAVDEGFTCTLGATFACGATTDVGECVIGMQACVSVAGGGSTLSACTGSVGPSAELCDGLDNDCDGAVDNGFNVGASCSNGQLGACLRTGTYQCNSTRNGTVCNAPTPAPGTEVCGNGVDEDCNGSDLACPAAPMLDIAVTDASSTAVALQTDVGPGPTFPWNTYDDGTSPFQWSRTLPSVGEPHLFRMNFFRTPGGNWICYSVSGVPTCRALPTLGIAGVSIPVSDYLATRTFIAPNTAALMCDPRYASCVVANIGYCQSATAFGCEIACSNGLDDDGDGLTDTADPNCN